MSDQLDLYVQVIHELRAELEDTRKDRDSAEAEVKELRATLDEVLEHLKKARELLK